MRWGAGIARRGVATAVVAVAALAALPASASALGGSTDPFCAPQTLFDYEAPLAGMPDVRELPKGGKLPFGPARVGFYRKNPSQDSLIAEGEPIEYEFSLDGAAHGPMFVDWTVESRLVRVDRTGRSLRLTKRRRQLVGALEVVTDGGERVVRPIGFGRSPEPGLYRYDLVFRNRKGNLLGHYHHHYRVVRDVRDVRLALNAATYRPGSAVLVQVRNYGPQVIFYGVGFRIERHLDYIDAWALIDNEEVFGRRLFVIAIGLGLRPGTSDKCYTGFTVPAKMTPGLYRIVKDIDVGEEEPREETVSAEFTVEPAV